MAGLQLDTAPAAPKKQADECMFNQCMCMCVYCASILAGAHIFFPYIKLLLFFFSFLAPLLSVSRHFNFPAFFFAFFVPTLLLSHKQ